MATATFNGKFNELKSKVWLFLAQERDSGRWYTSQELHDLLGVNLCSLREALCKWCSDDWRKVLRRKRNFLWESRLSARGAKWVKRYEYAMPRRYMAEIETWQREHGL